MKTLRLSFATILLAVLLLIIVHPSLYTQEPPYSTLVTNVRTLWSGGLPNAVQINTSAAVSIVMGNETTASFPSTFAVAGAVGRGRFVAVGHEGIFTDAIISQDNNLNFFVNAIRFLDKNNSKRVKILGGHREWLNFTNMVTARSAIEKEGFTAVDDRLRITSSGLSGIGVVVIGNAWESFSDGELTALRGYIQSGGSLLVAGLEWSWTQNNPNRAYPMNSIAAMCGIEWSSYFIRDNVNQRNDSPLFTVLYPRTLALTPTWESAIDFLRQSFAQFNTALPNVLQTQTAFRTDFIRNLMVISNIIEQPTSSDSSRRARIKDFLFQLLQNYPVLLRKGLPFALASTPTMAWVREKIQLTYVNSLMNNVNVLLPQNLRVQAVAALGLQGIDAMIMMQHGVLLLDNSRLSERQKNVINRYFELTPPRLRNIRYVMFESLLGAYPQPPLPLFPQYSPVNSAFAVASYPIINNFGEDLGQTSENQFPIDVQPRTVSTFSAALGHEMTHNIDFSYVDKTPRLRSRLAALRTMALGNDMELLRSMIGVQFFKNAPVEFIASIANQWYTDSYHALLLGLSRFDRNFRQPINQALFFVDLFSNETDTSQFFITTHLGDVTGIRVPLRRDAQGRITELKFRDTTYSFTLDAVGNVIGWSRKVTPLNTAPRITFAQSLFTIQPNTRLSFPITLNDENPVSVRLTAQSSSQVILPDGNIAFTGSGVGRIIHCNFMPGSAGELRLTITATDDRNLSSSTTVTIRVLPTTTISNNIYTALITNLRTVWVDGAPGVVSTIETNSVSVQPIVAGHLTTASNPSTFSLAGLASSGRFVAIGHDGLFTDANIRAFDNLRFFTNSIQFLDWRGRKSVIILGGHKEWLNFSNMSIARSALVQNGYTVRAEQGRITAEKLFQTGVVIIGNAWENFTNEEINALQQYLQSGGSLLLAGLGWSWSSYNPGKTYPMSAIGSMCGITWANTIIRDNINQYKSAPLFTRFFPISNSSQTVSAEKPSGVFAESSNILSEQLHLANDQKQTALGISAQVYPNPVQEACTLHYTLIHAEMITIELVNTDGSSRLVLWQGYQKAGDHQIHFAAGNVPNGVYLCRIISTYQSTVTKLHILR